MTPIIKAGKTLVCLLAGCALACSAISARAAGPIVIGTFDNPTETNGWTLGNGPNGAIGWSGTQDAGGTSSNGSLKVTLSTADTGPQVIAQKFGYAFNTSNYFSLSFDVKFDPSSGFNSANGGNNYGFLQPAFVDPGFSWHTFNFYQLVDTSYTNWQHVEVSVRGSIADIIGVVFQLQGPGGSTYSGNVTFYLDNIRVNPVPATFYVNQFTNAAEANAWEWQNWSTPGSARWVSTQDAGGASPLGSLQVSNYFDPSGITNYEQSVFAKNFSFDPKLFVFFDFDYKMDPASKPRSNGSGGYGALEAILSGNNYQFNSLGSSELTLSNTNWTHASYAIGGHGLTNVQQVILKLGQNNLTNTVIYYVDNIKIWTPQTKPALTLARAGAAGLQVTATAPGGTFSRNNIVTPAGAANPLYAWVGAPKPVTYSFSIASFPTSNVYTNFEAHMFLINDTTLQLPNFNETYSAADFNASDLVDIRLRKSDTAGVDFVFLYKTNLPNSSTYTTLASLHTNSALGTWQVTFTSDTAGALIAPGGARTNFTVPPGLVANFDSSAYYSYLAFGIQKNADTNQGQSAVFSELKMTGGNSPFDETFPGPGLTTPGGVQWVKAADDPSTFVVTPPNTAYWLSWTVPDTGYVVQSSPSLSGPWNPAGLTAVIQGTTMNQSPVRGTNLPAASAGFFRMFNPTGP